MPKFIIEHEVIKFDFIKTIDLDFCIDSDSDNVEYPIVIIKFQMPIIEAYKLREVICKLKQPIISRIEEHKKQLFEKIYIYLGD